MEFSTKKKIILLLSIHDSCLFHVNGVLILVINSSLTFYLSDILCMRFKNFFHDLLFIWSLMSVVWKLSWQKRRKACHWRNRSRSVFLDLRKDRKVRIVPVVQWERVLIIWPLRMKRTALVPNRKVLTCIRIMHDEFPVSVVSGMFLVFEASLTSIHSYNCFIFGGLLILLMSNYRDKLKYKNYNLWYRLYMLLEYNTIFHP